MIHGSIHNYLFMFSIFPWCACMDLNCFVTVILLVCLYNACVVWLIDHFDSIEMLAVCDRSWFTILLNRYICKFLFAHSDWFHVFHGHWITMLMLFLLIAMYEIFACLLRRSVCGGILYNILCRTTEIMIEIYDTMFYDKDLWFWFRSSYTYIYQVKHFARQYGWRQVYHHKRCRVIGFQRNNEHGKKS